MNYEMFGRVHTQWAEQRLVLLYYLTNQITEVSQIVPPFVSILPRLVVILGRIETKWGQN